MAHLSASDQWIKHWHCCVVCQSGSFLAPAESTTNSGICWQPWLLHFHYLRKQLQDHTDLRPPLGGGFDKDRVINRIVRKCAEILDFVAQFLKMSLNCFFYSNPAWSVPNAIFIVSISLVSADLDKPQFHLSFLWNHILSPWRIQTISTSHDQFLAIPVLCLQSSAITGPIPQPGAVKSDRCKQLGHVPLFFQSLRGR